MPGQWILLPIAAVKLIECNDVHGCLAETDHTPIAVRCDCVDPSARAVEEIVAAAGSRRSVTAGGSTSRAPGSLFP